MLISREVPPGERGNHDGKEVPGGNWQTKSHANRCGGGPRKWKRDADIGRNGDLEEVLVPCARRFRSFRNFDEYPHDHPWKTKRKKEPAESTVPGIAEIKAWDDRQSKHYQWKAVYPYDFTPKIRRKHVAGRGCR